LVIRSQRCGGGRFGQPGIIRILAAFHLGITTYVNGAPMNPIQLDTSTVATDTIAYVATDQNGLASTSTRTVIVEPSLSPSIISDDNSAAASPAQSATSSAE
jgi:hypothetical protein